MKKKELQLKKQYDKLSTAELYMKRDIKNEIISLWNQIIEQDFSEISPEFFKWVQKNIEGIDSALISHDTSIVAKQMKLWIDIDKYNKIDTSNFTPLEKKFVKGLYLPTLINASKSNYKQLKELSKKLLPNYEEFPKNQKELQIVWSQILEQDLSQISPEFSKWFKDAYLDLMPKSYIKHATLWSDVCQYIHSNGNKDKKLKEIETRIAKYLSSELSSKLLPGAILDGIIIRNVYLNGDTNLVELFGRLLPKPPVSLFPEDRVPHIIKERELEVADTIQNLVEINDGSIQKIESTSIKLQRFFRGTKRRKDEKRIISNSYNRIREEADKQKTTDELIRDTNTPYKPQCDEYPTLANRLLKTAKKIEPFTTVRHLTAKKSVSDIMDNGLLGRDSLLKRYKAFRPAALCLSDVENGDQDAICFGAFEIDHKCMEKNTAEFVLDLDKLHSLPSEKDNPCIFFKQRDLGFDLDKIRKITIGNEEFFFTHTKWLRCQTPNHTNIQFCNKDGYGLHHYAELPNFQMISSNFGDMNQILAMNFFRFLDEIRDSHCKRDKDFADRIYSALDKLDENEMESTLLQLTRNMSDTMEFNFYGSFLMSPNLIKEVSIFDKPNEKTYTLKIADFVKSLQEGDSKKLAEVQEKLPELLESYRFIDYLLLQIDNQPIRNTLLGCRKNITLPLWRQRVESSLLKGKTKEVVLPPTKDLVQIEKSEYSPSSSFLTSSVHNFRENTLNSSKIEKREGMTIKGTELIKYKFDLEAPASTLSNGKKLTILGARVLIPCEYDSFYIFSNNALDIKHFMKKHNISLEDTVLINRRKEKITFARFLDHSYSLSYELDKETLQITPDLVAKKFENGDKITLEGYRTKRKSKYGNMAIDFLESLNVELASEDFKDNLRSTAKNYANGDKLTVAGYYIELNRQDQLQRRNINFDNTIAYIFSNGDTLSMTEFAEHNNKKSTAKSDSKDKEQGNMEYPQGETPSLTLNPQKKWVRRENQKEALQFCTSK